MKFILFNLIAGVIYLVLLKIYERKILQKINAYINEKNEFYYNEFLKKYEKSKKIKITEKFNLKYKINLMIDKADIEHTMLINPISLVILGIICFIGTYTITFEIFKVVGLSVIISLPSSLIPFIALNAIAAYKADRLEKIFLNFLLQLKNYTKITNDVIGALKNIKTIEPLQSYLNKFNLEINSGIKFDIAMEHLKEKISIGKFKEFFNNIQYCYLYGGNFTTLIDKSYKMIEELQREKNKRKQETASARIVLFILIALDVFVYINFVKKDSAAYMIMRNTYMGMLILYWNFISMWFLIVLSEKMKKMDY